MENEPNYARLHVWIRRLCAIYELDVIIRVGWNISRGSGPVDNWSVTNYNIYKFVRLTSLDNTCTFVNGVGQSQNGKIRPDPVQYRCWSL